MSQSFSSSERTVLAILTDFGSADGYVGTMKGVILSITSHVHLIDITHDVPPQHVASAAWLLATSYRYFPAGTIFVCVVDPGVGSLRHPIALHVGNWFFVGPDNGLFSYVLAEHPVHEAVALLNPTYHLSQISATFHGRDIFAPVAAHLARGIPLSELGPRVDPATLQHLDLGLPVYEGEEIKAYIVHIDHFGNLISTIPASLVPDLFSRASVQLTFPTQGIVVTDRRRFFSAATTREDMARPFIYVDSSGYVAIALQNGNAAQALGIEYGDIVMLIR